MVQGRSEVVDVIMKDEEFRELTPSASCTVMLKPLKMNECS